MPPRWRGSTPVSHHITRLRKVDRPGEVWEVVLGFPSLGVWGVLLVWGGWALPWGVSPAGRWVHALGKYLDPTGDRDQYGPQNPAYGGTKISGDRPRGLMGAMGHK